MPDMGLTVAVGILAGAVAGLSAGLFGLGGGIVIVPALHFLFRARGFPEATLMHAAVTTSLFTILFTSAVAAWGHHRRRAVNFSAVGRLVPGILLGGLAGGWLADQIPSDWLQRFFALFELFVAWQLLAADGRPAAQRRLPGQCGMLLAGGGIGACATLLGIGGGTMVVPFLLWCQLSARTAIATAAACGVPIALAGGAAMILLGLDARGLPSHSLGYLYWPVAVPIILASLCTVPVGVWLVHTLPARHLRRAFAALLVIVAVYMLVTPA